MSTTANISLSRHVNWISCTGPYISYISPYPHRTPSKQKSPKEDKDIDIVELLRNVDPKEYEKYARMYGITDYRGLLQAIEQLKKEKGDESGRVVMSLNSVCLRKREREKWRITFFCVTGSGTWREGDGRGHGPTGGRPAEEDGAN